MYVFMFLLSCAVFGLCYHNDPVLATAVLLGTIAALAVIGAVNGTIWLVQRLKSQH